MKYKVELWQYHVVRQKFETDDYDKARDRFILWNNMYDEYGDGWTAMYIDGKRVMLSEKYDVLESM